MRNNKTGYYMTVDGEDEEIDIPFDIFVEAFKEYIKRYYGVTIEGNDIGVWNLFSATDMFDSVADDEDFLDICKSLYGDNR